MTLDGLGDFTFIQKAIDATPLNNPNIFTIYIKVGSYNGSFKISQGKINLMLIGDRIGKTVITSWRSNSTGYSLDTSAGMGDEVYIVLLIKYIVMS